MSYAASDVGSGNSSHVSTSHSLSKWKPYAFVIAIIVGIFGLAIGILGLFCYFHIGILSNIGQINAMIMMALGGGGGIILLIIGIVGIVKNRLASNSATHKSQSAMRLDLINSINTQGGLVYGPKAWKIWGVEVLDTVVPPAPKVDLTKKDKVLLYIPQKIKVNGEEKNLTLNVLKEMSGLCEHFDDIIQKEFGDNPAHSGWVLIDKEIIPKSRGKDFETQKKMVEANDCCMPTIMEALILNLMAFTFTGERLFGQDPWIWTRCIEQTKEGYLIVVGGFDSEKGLQIVCRNYNYEKFGVVSVRRKFL